MDFQYKVTVIVPVYNVEEYLRGCLDSLVAQTIDHSQMEVLLINDGSTDNSLDICYEYAQSYFMFKVFSKENEGVSATRNFGIRNAKGKYILYLDSDDTITSNTVKSVSDFFDSVYDQVDIVTYTERRYKNDGTTLPLHFRYNYMKKTGVYDITKDIFLCQTLMNIVVKNEGEENIFFDEKIGYHEDQIYCNTIINRKNKIGFVEGCEYKYFKHSGSISEDNMNSLFLFEKTIDYWEHEFAKYDVVPKYFQALFFHDMSWKLKVNALLPYHYDKEQYQNSLKRITALLDKVDDSVIMTCPSTDNFHRYFFLNMKSDRNNITVVAETNKISIKKHGETLYSNTKMEIIVNKIKIKSNNLFFSAHVKSPVFNFIEAPKVIAQLKYDDTVVSKEMNITLSADSYYHSKEQTNCFYAFNENFDISNIRSISFFVIVDGISFSCYYYFMPYSPFSGEQKKYLAIYDEYTVEYKNNRFVIEHLTKPQCQIKRHAANSEYMKKYPDVYKIREAADKMREKTIWLYYDCQGVEKDNGYYQFCHDINKNDGVERYYVNSNTDGEYSDILASLDRNNVVNFGSEKHKILYLASSKVITAYAEDRNILPFDKNEMSLYCDVSHTEIIYLQHGILHAHLPWKYAPGRVIADKIVISSYFEKENFTKIYHFSENDLISSGMPRFSHIDRSIIPTRRILFAPTWRSYLINEDSKRGWSTNEQKFRESDYYLKFNEFLTSKKLNDILTKEDVYLDVKLHPIFKPYQPCFDLSSERISFVDKSVSDESYSAFITDFSSFVFDFAYLKRPILYFVPDMLQFKSGMNGYRELDLPFEKAFGNLAVTAEEAVNEVIRIIENNFRSEDIFKERMESFFLPMHDCEEKLYESLVLDEQGENN